MANDIYSLQMYYRFGGQPGMNVLHMESPLTSSTQPDDDARELIEGWIADIQDDWLACLCAGVTLIGYKARRVNNGGGPTVTQPISGAVGTRTGFFSAGAIGPCIVVGYNTGTRWRSGRIFLPCVSESDIETDVFSAGLLTALDTMCVHLTDSPMFTTADGAWEYGIWSSVHETFSEAETAGVSGKPGVQNRRMKPAF